MKLKVLIININSVLSDSLINQISDKNCEVSYMPWSDKSGLKSLCHINRNINLLELINKNADLIRKKYTAWVARMGNTKDGNGVTIRSLLKLNPNSISFWWLGYLAQKDAISQPSYINNIYKLISLGELLNKEKYDRVVVLGANSGLSNAIEGMAVKHNCKFTKVNIKNNSRIFYANTFYEAFGWLIIKAIPRWIGSVISHRLNGKRRRVNKQFTMFTYFPNYDESAAELGSFSSNYFGIYNNWLSSQKDYQINWILLFGKSSMSYIKALVKINKFKNKNYNIRFLESFLKCSDFFKVFKDFISLNYKSKKAWVALRKNNAFADPKTGLNIEKLVYPIWKESYYGRIGLASILRSYAFKNISDSKIKQDWGCYCLENQPWERSLVYYWTLGKIHGPIYGYYHSIYKKTLLSFHEDPSIYKDTSDTKIPLPDYTVVSSKEHYNDLINSDYSTKNLKIAACLRYYYLKNYELNSFKIPKSKSLLITGSILKDATDNLVKSILFLLKDTDVSCILSEIWYKPHPFNVPEKDVILKLNKLGINIWNGTIIECIKKVTHVITTVDTAVSFEAYLMGRSTAVYSNLNILNTSPLVGVDGVTFPTNGKQIINWIKSDYRHQKYKTSDLISYEPPLETIIKVA